MEKDFVVKSLEQLKENFQSSGNHADYTAALRLVCDYLFENDIEAYWLYNQTNSIFSKEKKRIYKSNNIYCFITLMKLEGCSYEQSYKVLADWEGLGIRRISQIFQEQRKSDPLEIDEMYFMFATYATSRLLTHSFDKSYNAYPYYKKLIKKIINNDLGTWSSKTASLILLKFTERGKDGFPTI